MDYRDANTLVHQFHAHVYYTSETRASAAALRERMATLSGGRLELSTLSDGLRGPHASLMFGVDIPRADLPEVLGFLMLNHGPHAVLVHPVTDNEVMDHSHHALWLGQPQPLDLARLL